MASGSPHGSVSAGTSGKAIASLVLGLLAFCVPLLPGLPGLILGFVSLGDINRSGGRLGGKGLAIGGILASVLGTLFLCGTLGVWVGTNTVSAFRRGVHTAMTVNNMKQIGLAMHNYHSDHGSLPPAAKRLPNGQRGLSWRVLLLPYVEQDVLYRQFHLDEPWDSPHNKTLLASMPSVYAGANYRPGVTQTTPFQVFVGPGSMFEETSKPITFANIPDGLPNTVLVVEARDEVPWTKPEDLSFDPAKPLPPLGVAGGSDFWIVYGEGSVVRTSTKVDEKTLKSLITRNGNEPVIRPTP